MLFENGKAFNFEGAFSGMRNPMNSWERSDSFFGLTDICNNNPFVDVCDHWIENENKIRIEAGFEPYSENDTNSESYYDALEKYENWLLNQGTLSYNGDIYNVALLGPKDLELAQKLILAGGEHAKFMRQIFVSVDISAPIYWWKEMDTYKVSTTANSTSTMHKLTSKPFKRSDFEFDNGENLIIISGSMSRGGDWKFTYEDYINNILAMCNNLRDKYLSTKDKAYWRALIQLLPEAYLQTRTWTANYAVLRNIYFQRKNHKLKEWHQFCKWIESLPYSKELITLGDKNEN